MAHLLRKTNQSVVKNIYAKYSNVISSYFFCKRHKQKSKAHLLRKTNHGTLKKIYTKYSYQILKFIRLLLSVYQGKIHQKKNKQTTTRTKKFPHSPTDSFCKKNRLYFE